MVPGWYWHTVLILLQLVLLLELLYLLPTVPWLLLLMKGPKALPSNLERGLFCYKLLFEVKSLSAIYICPEV